MYLHATYATEAVDTRGPTGEFYEVLEAEVRDFGGNVLAGPAPISEIMSREFRTPVNIVPTKLGHRVETADHAI